MDGEYSEEKKTSQRLIATPATRTFKISVFYPKNSQKLQTLLLVGSRHTSDDSPTVTQIYLYYSRASCVWIC